VSKITGKQAAPLEIDNDYDEEDDEQQE